MKKFLYGALGILVAGAGTALILKGHPANAASSPFKTSITVSGTAVSMVTPNKAQIMLGVTNQAATAAAALSANNTIMAQVTSAMRRLGIPLSDIATSGLSINPNYNQANPPAVTGYQVSDNLTVTTSVGLAGRAIDKAVAAGANQVNGVNFVTPPSSTYRQAYHAALRNARVQSEAVASGIGEHVLGVTSVVIQSQGAPPPQLTMFNAAVSAPSTAVYPGQQQESVTLKVVYRLGS